MLLSDDIFAGSRDVEIDGVMVGLISLENFLEVKRSSDRPLDLADADELAKIKQAGSEQ